MSTCRRSRLLLVVAVAAVTAACAGGSVTTAPSSSPAGSGSAAATPTATPSPTAGMSSPGTASATPVAAGPVWPIEARTLPAVAGRGPAVLRSITWAQHGSYERLVLAFTSAYGAVAVRYVPLVRADPSNAVVALPGSAYLSVVVHGAASRWPVTGVTPYGGPTVVRPGYRTIEAVAVAGDFEAVLSFGVGLGRVAGYHVYRLRSPDRLVIDVAEPPTWRSWPDDSPAMAVAAQTGYDAGHLPWRGSAPSVAWSYAFAVYGWTSPVVVATGPVGTFRISEQGSRDHVTIHLAAAFPAHSRSVFEVTGTR